MKKKIFIIILVILLLFGIGAIVFFFLYQPEPEIIDEIRNGRNYEEEDGGEKKENQGTLNKNVYIYSGEDADNINAMIDSVEYGEKDLVLHFADDKAAGPANLGIGDIFWLEGDSSTPLRETYIGKVVSNNQQGEERLVTVESPMIDEIFDEIYIDSEFEIQPDDIKNISTVDGVTVTPAEMIPENFLDGSIESSLQTRNITADTVRAVTEMTSISSSHLGSLVIEIDADLSELLSVLETGESGKEKNPETESVISAKKSCKIKGKVGLEDLKYNFTADYNKEYGMKELSAGISGKQVFSAGITMSLSGEVSGKTTQADILSFVKLQGLKQKVFPIAYFDCASKVPMVISGINKSIENKYKCVPFSCGFMVYLDIYGNLSLEMVESYECVTEFENRFALIENNQYVGSFKGENQEPETRVNVKLTAAADADIHIGTSALLYLFNVNILDIGIVKVGGEVEGNGSLEYSSDEEKDNGLNADFYARLYIKIINVKVCIKAQVNMWIVDIKEAAEWEGTFLDLTLLETGQKRETHFNESTMLWNKITAEDEDSFFYKGTDGNLLRETKDSISRKVIYEGDFFSICGLDESYIYILDPVKDETYNVRRISKDGTVTKIILEDVKYVLKMTEHVFFYVPAFSENEIYQLNRFTLKKELYAEFDESVELMTEQDGGYLVTTERKSAFSWVMGPDCTYYSINLQGEVLETYDGELTPQQCVREDKGSYYAAFVMLSNGYLRETAEKGYWLSKDKSTYTQAEGCSGWNPTKAGILAELEREDGLYDVILYQASDGSPKTVVQVNSAQAFFTFVQDDSGNWYYMDQADTTIDLYRMDSSFLSKKKLDSVSLQEIPCDMESCTMEIVNNRLFFYTMPSWSNSKVLYRYNLY